jgi:hypothetical protein
LSAAAICRRHEENKGELRISLNRKLFNDFYRDRVEIKYQIHNFCKIIFLSPFYASAMFSLSLEYQVRKMAKRNYK